MNEINNNCIGVIEKISKYEIEKIINKKLFELQVIPEELYKNVMDKLLVKIELLKKQ